MTDFNPRVVAAADQFFAAMPEFIDDAVRKMRVLLAQAGDDDAMTIAELSVSLANLCDENPEVRGRVACGYVALLHRMARQS